MKLTREASVSQPRGSSARLYRGTISRPLASAVAVLCLILALAVAPPASAQYIYIDTNGDGFNSWNDSLNTVGNTAVDIWINIGANRNGSSGGCNKPGLVSFSLIIKAVGGTMTWGAFTNAMGPASGPPSVSTPTEYHIAVALADSAGIDRTQLPLGMYKLGTLNVSIASGNPCLDFATSTTMSPRHKTSYGMGCHGQKFDNTNRLGPGWADEDGVSPLPSAPPFLTAPGMVLPRYLDPVVVDVHAASTSCGPVSSLTADLSALPAGSNAVFTPASGNQSGTLTWQPTAADHGDFLVSFRATGKNPNAASSKTTVIRLVTNPTGVRETDPTPVFALWQSRPNPFNPTTTIVYSVPQSTHVRLIVYDISGRSVARLVDRVESPGRHEVHWPGLDDRGQPLASGVYGYRLTTAFGTATRRLVLAR